MYYALISLRIVKENLTETVTKEWMVLSKAETKSRCILSVSKEGVIFNFIELTEDEFNELVDEI